MSKIFDRVAANTSLHIQIFIELLFAANLPLSTYFDEPRFARTCDECGTGMNEGYFIRNTPEEHYCTEKCLHKHYTPEEWKEMYEGDEDDYMGNDTDYCYWTEWDPETDCD